MQVKPVRRSSLNSSRSKGKIETNSASKASKHNEIARSSQERPLEELKKKNDKFITSLKLRDRRREERNKSLMKLHPLVIKDSTESTLPSITLPTSKGVHQ